MNLATSTQLVTRVVTCYRQWDFVRLWLPDDSLFQPHARWLIINDDPSDPPPEDLQTQLRRRGVELKTPLFNRGVSAARNLGLLSASTPWVEFADGDDWPLPLSEAPMREHAGTALLIYKFVLHTLNGSKREEVKEWPFNPSNTDDVSFIFTRDPRLDARAAVAVWDRQALVDLGGFDSRFDGVEDLHLAWKVDRSDLRFDFVPEAKQSYYWCNPAQAAVEWRRQSQLRLFLLFRQHSTPDRFEALDRLTAKYAADIAEVGLNALEGVNSAPGQGSTVSTLVGMAARAIYWRSRRMLKSTALGMPFSFRVKEAIKTLLGRV